MKTIIERGDWIVWLENINFFHTYWSHLLSSGMQISVRILQYLGDEGLNSF